MKKRVLVVEDELGNRRLLEYLLKEHYETAAVTNGKAAVEWLKEGNPVDLIITDIEMPVMNGLELIASLKATRQYARIPVVILSDVDEEILKERLDGYQAQRILRKPVQPKTLYWKVEESLKRTV